MAPRSPHPAQCLLALVAAGAPHWGHRGSAHPRPPSPSAQGDAGVSWKDAVGAGKRRAPHPQSTHREDGVSGEPTLFPVPTVRVPPRRAKEMRKSPWQQLRRSQRSSGRAAQDSSLGGQQHPPGKQTLGRGWGVELSFARPPCSPRAPWPGGEAEGTWQGHARASARCKQPPPQQQLLCREPAPGVSELETRWCSPNHRHSPLATARSQEQALGDPRAAQHPALGPRRGGRGAGGAGKAPQTDRGCQGVPGPIASSAIPVCVPRDGVSQGMEKGGRIQQRGFEVGC